MWKIEERTIPQITVSAVVKGGAAADPRGLDGIADFTLDMLFQGANGVSNIEISKRLKKISAVAGTTSQYLQLLLTIGTPSWFGKEAARILSDLFLKPDFPEKEVERVKKIKISSIINDMNSIDELCAVVRRALLYGIDSPMGHQIPGKLKTVENFSRTQTCDFHKSHFVAGNTALIVTGDIDETALEVLRETFGGAAKKGETRLEELSAKREESTLYLLRKDGVTSSFVTAFFHSIPRNDPRYPAASIFNSIYGGQFSSRLMKKMREEKGYTYQVHSYFTLQNGIMPWTLTAMVEKGKETEAVLDIFKELEKILTTEPPGLREFNEAKEGFLARYFQNFETQLDLVQNFAKLFALSLPVTFYEETFSSIQNSALKEVIAYSREIFSTEKLSFLVIGDIGEDLKRLPFKKIVELKEEDYI